MNVLFTTYLTKKNDPQRQTKVLPNDPKLMDTWYEGASKYESFVFHDELSDEFMAKYPKVTFVKVGNYKYSANDGRFQIFNDYLKKMENIDYVFITDLFDVKVNSYPKKLNKKTLYVQQEPRTRGPLKTFWRADWGWARNQFTKCFGPNVGDKDYYQGLIGKSIYNAGVWGGSRAMVMKVCKYILNDFDIYNVEEKNCNMLIFNKILYHVIGQENIDSSIASVFGAYEMNSVANFIHK